MYDRLAIGLRSPLSLYHSAIWYRFRLRASVVSSDLIWSSLPVASPLQRKCSVSFGDVLECFRAVPISVSDC